MTEQTLTDREIETGGFARMEAEADADGTDGDADGPTATQTAPTATAPTGRTATPAADPTRTAPIPTPTQKTRPSEALARCVEPVDAGGVPRRLLGAAAARRAARRGGSFRRPPVGRGRRAAGLLRRVADARPPDGQGGRDDLGGPVRTGDLLAAEAVHRRRRPGPRRGGVRGRLDDRAPGAAPHVAAARTLLPGARGGARQRRPGELVLHAAPLAGLRRPPRHARRLRPPGRGREALARVRAAARAAAEGAALVVVARRAGPDRARADAASRGHALSPPRLAARRAHLGDRFAAHHGRRQRPHLDRRVPGGAWRSVEDDVEFRRSVPDRRRAAGRPRRAAGRAARRRGRPTTRHARSSSGAAGRSSTGTSRRSASSTRSRSTRRSSAGRR